MTKQTKNYRTIMPTYCYVLISGELHKKVLKKAEAEGFGWAELPAYIKAKIKLQLKIK